jgi:hypothetical protein
MMATLVIDDAAARELEELSRGRGAKANAAALRRLLRQARLRGAEDAEPPSGRPALKVVPGD